MKKIRYLIFIIILMIQPVFVKASPGDPEYIDLAGCYLDGGYGSGDYPEYLGETIVIYADIPEGYEFDYFDSSDGIIYENPLITINQGNYYCYAYFKEIVIETATIYFWDGYINGNSSYAEVNVGEYAYIEVDVPSGQKLDYVEVMGETYYEEAFDFYVDEAYANMTINIEAYFSALDSTPPVFSGPSVINTTKYEILTVSNIKARLSAYDVVDGNVTSRIALYSNNYSTNASINGTYQMIFRVWDVANNWAYWTITINVKDMDPPIIYVNDWFVSISEFDNITLEKIIEILSYQS